MRTVRCLLPSAIVVLLATLGYGQIHGTPPSVTSIRPGTGISNFPPPSVTSMGPLGWDVPSNTEIPPFTPNPQFSSEPQFTHHYRHFGNARRIGNRGFRTGVVPAIVPYYVPYYMPAPAYPLVYPGVASPGPLNDDGTPNYDPPGSASAVDPPASDPPAETAVTLATPDPPADATAPAQEEATILVFRDGHQLNVHNYAIVGDQVFNFSNSGPRKIPLSELDIAATRRVNDDRGVDFLIPAAKH